MHTPYGTWPSPLSPAELAADLRLGDVGFSASGSLVWLEGRGGVGTLIEQSPRGGRRELTRGLSVRAELGYGGGDFAVWGERVFFAVKGRGSLYCLDLQGGGARTITPDFGRCASPAISPDGEWVVMVHHHENIDRLAVVATRGGAWPQILVEGHDFFMQPRFSPDGRRLAWVAWDHPDMPWLNTTVYVADFAEGRLHNVRAVDGGDGVAIFQPEFIDADTLAYVSDRSGRTHLWCAALGGDPKPLTEGEAELGTPAWVQGMRTFAVSSPQSIVAVRQREGFAALVQVPVAKRGVERGPVDVEALTPLPAFAEYTELTQPVVSADGRRVACLGSAPHVPPRVLMGDLASSEPAEVMARASTEAISPGYLSRPSPRRWTTRGGGAAYGLFYPPTHPTARGEGAPPLVVLVHGGPTSHATAGWDPRTQFFTSRGWAVLWPNHRGSTGYGRAYMEAMRGEWGVVDVEDVVSGVRALTESGEIDPKRCVIAGGSAGGFTVYQTLIWEPEVFAAGLSWYGVADPFALTMDTHKFEAHYNDWLLGTLPQEAARYRERSPVLHAHRIRVPVAIFQGDADQVVPKNQSDAIARALAKNGVPHEYHVYPNEGHGFRDPKNLAHFYQTVDRFLVRHVLFA